LHITSPMDTIPLVDAAALKPGALDELEDAINRLQKIKKALEESPNLVDAKAEQVQKTRDHHVAMLHRTIESHQREVELLLGYPLDPSSQPVSCDLYMLLPAGHVDQSQMSSSIMQYQTEIKMLEEAKLHAGADETIIIHRGILSTRLTLAQHEQQISHQKSMLLRYLMQNTPINAVEFRAKLTPHMDGLLEAFRELRTLEMS
jgi:hypothetical protein